MGTTYLAKINSFTNSIVVDGKNTIEVKINYDNTGSGDYESEVFIEFGNQYDYKYIVANKNSPYYTDKVTFTIPVSWLGEIPDSPTGTGIIRVRTVNMMTAGIAYEDVKNFTVYVPEEFKPELSNVSLFLRDVINHSRCDYAIYGITAPEIEALVTPHFTSPIKRYRITGGGIDVIKDFPSSNLYPQEKNYCFDGTVIKTWLNTNLTLTVIDGRGRTASATTETFYVHPYSRPSIKSFSAYRTDKDGIAKADGDHIKVQLDAAFSPIRDSSGNEVNSIIYCKVEWNEVNDNDYGHTEYIENNEPFIFEANKDFAFEIKGTVADEFMETEAYYYVTGDNKDFNVCDGGGGAAIGTKAEKGYFDVAHESRFQKGISANNEVKSESGFVSTGLGSKGDFLSFGRAERIFTEVHYVPAYDEKGNEIGTQPVVWGWGDFNECLDIGLYGVYYNEEVESSNYYKVMNVPCEKAGTLRVYNATGNMDDYALTKHLMQEYVVYDGSEVYRRCISKIRDNTDVEWPAVWTFGSWYRYSGTKI